jgi:hypothetical protein
VLAAVGKDRAHADYRAAFPKSLSASFTETAVGCAYSTRAIAAAWRASFRPCIAEWRPRWWTTTVARRKRGKPVLWRWAKPRRPVNCQKPSGRSNAGQLVHAPRVTLPPNEPPISGSTPSGARTGSSRPRPSDRRQALAHTAFGFVRSLKPLLAICCA